MTGRLAARDALRKAAVDALYAARDSGNMMDQAAEAVLDAVLSLPNELLRELGGSWNGNREGRAEWWFPEGKS